MHPNDPNESTLLPTMKKATVGILSMPFFIWHRGHVSGEILHVDGADPARRW